MGKGEGAAGPVRPSAVKSCFPLVIPSARSESRNLSQPARMRFLASLGMTRGCCHSEQAERVEESQSACRQRSLVGRRPRGSTHPRHRELMTRMETARLGSDSSLSVSSVFLSSMMPPDLASRPGRGLRFLAALGMTSCFLSPSRPLALSPSRPLALLDPDILVPELRPRRDELAH